MKISIIVPCYNEEAALPIFYKEVKKVLMGLTSTYELIFVNDGSKDHTLPLPVSYTHLTLPTICSV